MALWKPPVPDPDVDPDPHAVPALAAMHHRSLKYTPGEVLALGARVPD